MTTIERLSAPDGPVDGQFWPHLVSDLAVAWSSRGIEVRDAIVLLPHAGLLAVARKAFASLGAWLPRIETPRTLASSLGPMDPPRVQGPTLDVALDRVHAAALLSRRMPGQEGRSLDPVVFTAAVNGFVDTAHEVLRASWSIPPDARDAWWRSWRDALSTPSGPGAIERALVRAAVEWAASATQDPWARLWDLRPSAWVAVTPGVADALSDNLLQRGALAGVPCWRVHADMSSGEGLRGPSPPSLHRLTTHQPEEEAQGAARAVLDALEAGHGPVVLVAEDRLLVRRVRALLERAGVAIADETGWTLSTTRSASRVMAVLRAAARGAGRDALMEALKAENAESVAVRSLEAAWRREQRPDQEASTFERAARERLAVLRGTGPRGLQEWLVALRVATPGLLADLATDPAGRAVLAALRLDRAPSDADWLTLGSAPRLDLDGFITWVSDALDAVRFLPPAPPNPEVVVTPLAAAVLRPFAAAVFPGCDEVHLGARVPAIGWLPDDLRRQQGLPDAEQRRLDEAQSFAQLLRLPRVTLLRRTHEGSEPLAPSPLVELAMLARRRAGWQIPDEAPVTLPRRTVASAPITRPAPVMADAMPTRLSASAAEALRDCPYRFFARSALGLTEPVEFEDEPDKRDHGRWLHAVLQAFHEARRDAPATNREDDRRRLLEAGASVDDAHGLDAAGLWPYRASFASFVDHYLDWLGSHEAAGWRYSGGELPRRLAPPQWQGITLEGRLDRIDMHVDGQAMVVDYKTGGVDALRRKVKTPLEDTQLAAYAALLTEEPSEPAPRAIYLALQEREEPAEIEHRDPARSAAQWVEGLAGDLESLRRGQGAAALGEEAACEFCEMRGLCRRDHWSDR